MQTPFLAAAAAAVLFHAGPTFAQFPTTVLVRSGTPIPDLPGRTISSVDWFSMDPTGGISLNLSAGGAGSGIYRLHDGVPRLVALQGSQAPGAQAGEVFSIFGTEHCPAVQLGPGTAFFSFLSGPGITEANGSGIWMSQGLAPSLAVRRGAPAPEAGVNATIGAFSRLVPGAPGAVYTSTRISDPAIPHPDDSALWRFGSGGRTLLARFRDPAPGLPGFTFESLTLNDWPVARVSISANRTGMSAFSALAFHGTTFDFAHGIWRHTDQTGTQLIARAQATGLQNLDPQVKLNSHSRLVLADSGKVAFRTGLWAPSGNPLVTSSTNTAIVVSDFSAATPQFATIARENDPIPGRNVPWRIAVHTGSATDNNRFYDPAINNAGHVAFSADLNNPNYVGGGNGVFLHDGLALRTLSISGDPITDRPGNISLTVAIGQVLMNEHDDVAYLSLTSIPGGYQGLFAHIAGGPLTTIALRGDQVQVASGLTKTIQQFVWGGVGWPSPPPALSNDRVLYYGVQFTDGSTALLSTQIPTPGTAPMLLLFVLAARRRRP